MASGKALTNSRALLMTWPDGQELGGGKIQELVTRKFRKKHMWMGLLEWVQNMRIFVFHVAIYQALISNQVDKMVRFPSGTTGFAQWVYEQSGHGGQVEGLA